MPYGFGDNFLSELRMKCDIETVIGKYVDLKKSGNTYVGLCPFHNEKTPSFHVTPSKQIFYCFGCNTGGDVISFIMKIENLSYTEAVHFLADMVGMQVPERDYLDTEITVMRKKILEMNREAARFYYKILLSEEGRRGQEYFLQRGLNSNTIRKFGLGYSIDNWNSLTQYLTDKGYTLNDMVAAGLATKSSKGYFDRFRNRVMFPIIDHRGNVIGFGGRTLEKTAPAKYLNSSENLVFRKGKNVYALNYAKNTKENNLIMCEGYMDVIALHQFGFSNAIATLGTALTSEQARLLRRFTQNIILCYDSDEAGRKATKRAIDILTSADLNVKVITVTGGKDPDELLRSEDGPETFKRLIQVSENSTDYKLDTIRKKYNLSIDSEKIDCIREMVSILAYIRSPVERAVYTDKVSRDVSISKESIEAEIKNKRRKIEIKKQTEEQKQMLTDLKDFNDRINPQRPRYLIAAKAEEDIISILLNYPEKISEINSLINEDDFITDFNRRVFNAIEEKIQLDPTGDHLLSLSDYFNPDEISHINKYLTDMQGLNISDDALNKTIKRLKEQKEKILQGSFNSDEAFQAQLERIRGKKKNGNN